MGYASLSRIYVTQPALQPSGTDLWKALRCHVARNGPLLLTNARLHSRIQQHGATTAAASALVTSSSQARQIPLKY
jgi:hypothetical protein